MKIKNILLLLFTASLFFLVSCTADTPERNELKNIIDVEKTTYESLPVAEEENKAIISTPLYNEYTITLDINPETKIVKGVQRVHYINKTEQPLDHIYFNVYYNAFSNENSVQPYFNEHRDKIFPNGREYGYFNISSVLTDGTDTEFEFSETVLKVDFNETLLYEDTIEITLQFEAYIPEINHRTGSNSNAIWLGNFIPQTAVYENGKWRTDPYYPAGDPFYTDTANYTVTVTAPSDYTVVATGIVTDREENGIKTTSISAKLVRDFALVLTDNTYNVAKLKTQSNVDINFYYRSVVPEINAYIEKIEEAVDFFSKTIGIYPYEKLDIVETGFFLSGAMEYPQIVFVDTDFLTGSGNIERTLVHEIGHQWFYNIIGSDQINHAWMDEGLTTMLQEYLLTSGSEEFHSVFRADYENFRDGLNSSNAYMLSDDLSKYSSWSDYYRTHYLKGKLMAYNLCLKMGEEKFNEFLRLYYSKYSFQNASVSDFIDTASEVHGESLTDFFDLWLYSRDLPPMEGEEIVIIQ